MATISTDKFEKNAPSVRVLRALYGDAAERNIHRFGKLAARHKEAFGTECADFFSSPGRIEIVGNHTDHNAGKVLAAAVTVDTLAAVSPREDGVIEVKSENYPVMRIAAGDTAFREEELGTSVALIKGVAEYFTRAGKATGGFNACMDSLVPKGSGVSSSSSFELAVAEIFNVYYNDGKLSPIFMAKASQYAENVYFGKPSGLMDQSAIALGGVNMIDFRSFDSDLTDDYAAIPAELKSVAAALGGTVLRDIPESKFYEEEEGLRAMLPPRALLRAEHFYEENRRVERALRAVEDGDEGAFLREVNASGLSSQVKLQNLYSERGDRSIERGLEFASTLEGVLARRVHGGGFAGTILLFVAKDSSDSVNDSLITKFGKNNVFRLMIRDAGACRIVFGEE